ncbi:MAG: DUF402 domain-containing protein [Chloroflexi bacterium]|nr:DUF402 domain-containing protein [Chloroflexota bacterium]
MTPYRPGDQVVLREVWQGRLWTVRPVAVVRDSPNVIALYIAPGTAWLRPYSRDGRALRLPEEEWVLREARWDNAVLRLTRPGDAHSVLDGWDEAGARFTFWYINLEEPIRRTAIGFDYMDHVLDVVVSRDLTAWRWKDEDELREAVARGLFSEEQAAAIRADGERALKSVLRRGPPLDERWEEWWADPGWAVPELPAGWDTPGK